MNILTPFRIKGGNMRTLITYKKKNNHNPIFTHLSRKRRGTILILVAILMLILILFIGLSLDAARIVLVGIQLQNTADAAALAGARIVRVDPEAARLKTYDFAYLNNAHGQPVTLEYSSDTNTGDIILGKWDSSTRTFTPTDLGPNAVKAVARKNEEHTNGSIPLLFGPIVDVFTADFQKHAIAKPDMGLGAGLIALAEDGVGVLLQGSLDVEIEPDGVIYLGAAGIQINSNDPDEALKVTGNIGEIIVDEINFDDGGGSYDKHGDLDGIPQSDDGDIPDPLKFLQSVKPNPADYPNWAADGNTVKITEGIHEFEPGYYPGGFSLTGGDTTLQPGVYILGGGNDGNGGLDIAGNANFHAKGVMFFITEGGNVEINGNGIIEAHAIDYWNPYSTVFSDPPPGSTSPPYEYPVQFDTANYKGILFFQDNLDLETAKINGTADLNLKGTLYFPENTVYLSGESANFGTQYIGHRFEIEGNGALGIGYDGRFMEASIRAYLVE
jgi:Flp pilus assembly protein TadG